MRKEERIWRKREKRIYRWLKKLERDAKSRPRPVVPDYMPPSLLWSGKECMVCGAEELYYKRWDAYFCPECNEWKEKKCSDLECWFCPHRPDRPFTEAELVQWHKGELSVEDPSDLVKKSRPRSRK